MKIKSNETKSVMERLEKGHNQKIAREKLISECQRMKEKSDRLELKTEKLMEEGKLSEAIETYKKVMELDREMRERCNNECSCTS